MSDIGRLVISCPDRPGIVAAVSTFLAASGANILSSHQYSTDPTDGTFFIRVEFHMPGLAVARPALEQAFEPIAGEFGMQWRLVDARPKKVALLASRYDHCLLDVLWRWRRGDLPMDVVCVISNHEDLATDVASFGVPYHHVETTPGTKADAELAMIRLLKGKVDLVVLARYMQILSGTFLAAMRTPVINIHHSFLPGFVGANPYARARERGVKLIGATAHYVTEELDAGPIIEQDVMRVTHAETAGDLERVGRDIERLVLARALEWHLADRVIVEGQRTVVFT